MSIRFRLALWYGVALAALLVLSGVAVRAAVEQQLQRDIDASLVQPADEVEGELQAQESIAAFTPGVSLPFVATFRSPGLYVQIDDAHGLPIAGARSPSLQDDFLPFPAAMRDARPPSGSSYQVVSLGGTSVRLYTYPLHWHGKVVGYVQVGRSLFNEAQALRTLTTILLLVGGAALVATSIVAWLVAGSALRPLATMTGAARSIARSRSFGERLPSPRSEDELGALAAAFNDVLTSLDAAHALQQRFLTDASHELRTPLTALAANLDYLAMAPDAPRAQREEARLAARRSVTRMGRLVNDLLYLARAESGQELIRRPVELDRLVVAAYREIKPLANDVRTSLASVSEAVVLGDPDQLQQVLLIVLDNALKYTPAGGSVSLALETEDGWAIVSVRDTGIGIAREELPRIFDRLYRSPQAARQNADGSGLGLAIARSIVEAHGGRIDVESAPGEGSLFRVSLPARPDPTAPKSPAGSPHDP